MGIEGSYPIKQFRVNRNQLEFMRRIFEINAMTENEINAFKHIISYVYLVDGNRHWFCAMSKGFLRKHFGGVTLLRLCDDKEGPLKVWHHSAGRCRRFKIHQRVTDEFERLSHGDHEAFDLIRERRMLKPYLSKLTTSSGHAYSEPINSALRVHNSLPKLFDRKALTQEIQWLRRAGKEHQAKLGEIFLRQVDSQLISDPSGLPVTMQKMIEDGLEGYIGNYRVSESGRIYENRAGTQTLPTILKRAAFSDNRIRNYDLCSSHPNILLQLLEDFNRAFATHAVDLTWLREYLSGGKSKKQYADAAGLSVDCWKTCLYAYFYGAKIKVRRKWPRSLSGIPKDHPGHMYKGYAIFDTICESLEEEFPIPDDLMSEAQKRMGRVKALLGGFGSGRDKFLKAIVTEALDKPDFSPDLLRIHRNGKARSVSNACGQKKLIVEKSGDRHQIDGRTQISGSHLLSFALQGAEAAFIHRLTILGTKYAYLPIGNEHDGLIVIGRIPSAAVEEAKKQTGLRYAELVEKDF